MTTLDGATELFECDSCGNVGLGQGEIRCCGRPMGTVDVDGGVDVDTDVDTDVDVHVDVDTDVDGATVRRPTLDDLLGTVFDMSDTELELCLCVMEGGELTVKRLAEETGYDRSVVTRHLDHLVDLGVVEKRRRLLERGGQVYVYTPVAPDAVREAFTRGFLAWVVHASNLLDDLRREKVESIVERGTDEPQWKIFQTESE